MYFSVYKSGQSFYLIKFPTYIYTKYSVAIQRYLYSNYLNLTALVMHPVLSECYCMTFVLHRSTLLMLILLPLTLLFVLRAQKPNVEEALALLVLCRRRSQSICVYKIAIGDV